MANDSFTEKRAFQRFPVALPMAFSDSPNGTQIKACTQDISAQGICMITDKPLTPGSELNLFLYPENNTSKIFKRGKVVWSLMQKSGIFKTGLRLEEPNLNPIPIILRAIIKQRNY